MELPEFYLGGYFNGGATKLSPEKKPAGGDFTVDDLLDFSNEDPFVTTADGGGGFFGPAADSSAVTAVDSRNSSVSGGDAQFSGNRSFGDSQISGDLCVPYDDLAELEWLSNFVEDSFSADKDLQSLQFLSVSNTTKPQTPETCSSSETPQNAPLFPSETPLPGKARSKRSRAAPGDWSTRLLHLITPNNDSDTKPPKPTLHKKRDGPIGGGNSHSGSDSSGRKCLHCAAEKTPQWRTGPMGPKTLCNACGVRYKSGRLVPEYRPAASPTFVSARHSNSHRKVLELRRQKEVQRSHHHQFLSQSSIFGVSNGGHDEYLIHHHNVSDFRQMM